jgi:hypothetical protein
MKVIGKIICVFIIASNLTVALASITTINDIDTLKNYSGSQDGEQVSVLGYYSDTPGKGGGMFYRATSTSLIDNNGTIIQVTGTNIFWIRTQYNNISIEMFGARAGNEQYADINRDAFEDAVSYAAGQGGGTVYVSGNNGIYSLSAPTYIGAPNVALKGNQASLKLKSGASTNWLVIKQCPGFSFSGFILDGNRGNVPSFGVDDSLVAVFDTEDVTISDMTVKNSYAKGISITSSTSGNGTRNIKINNIIAYNCRYQCIMTDSTGSPDCEKVLIANSIIKDTDHGGIVINDGSRLVTVSNCISDVNNSAWDAISIRNSEDISIVNCIGRRGRCGILIYLSDNALSQGFDCRNITLSGNIWEYNSQPGVQIVGAQNVSISSDISKNNYSNGFNVTQSLERRASNVTMSSVQAFDDQQTATQIKGINIAAADKVYISSPVCHGNSQANITYLTGDTEIYVSNDGPDGATRKTKKATTANIPAGSSLAIDVPWDTPFVDSNLIAQATIFDGTSSTCLRVHHVAAVTTNMIRVVVVNDWSSARSGILHVSAERN